MKILMFGRGVIATTYGWALEQAGHQVEFYVRPGRTAAYGSGVDIDLVDLRRGSRRRPVIWQWPARYRETLDSGHDFDLIILSVSHHRLPEAVEYLAPRIGDATVLVFGNIWVEPSDAIGDIPLDRVVWGFPGAGGGFGEDGVLHAALLPSVTFGTIVRSVSDRERAVQQVFRAAGCRINEQSDFRGWLWIHFVADAGIHSQGVRLGSLSKMVGNAAAIREWMLATRELLPLVSARGVDLRRHRRGLLLFRAPSWLTGPALARITRCVAPARRSLEAHTDPDAAEPREICRDTLAEARRLGISTPRLDAAEAFFTSSRSE